MTTTVFDHQCPYCGVMNQAATGREGTTPRDGSIALCWDCREPSVFVINDMVRTVRKPSEEEREEILADPAVKQARAAMFEAYYVDQAAALAWPKEQQ